MPDMRHDWLSACVLLVACPVFAADNKRPITETDLYSFQWIAGPQISPDGSRIVYTQIRVTAKHDNYAVSYTHLTLPTN